MVHLAVALVHWPVMDRPGNVVCSSITNLDIHDIARACRVFGVEKYFLVSRMEDQLGFVQDVMEHWKNGPGVAFNPMRKTSLTMVETARSISEAVEAWGCPRENVIATSAKDPSSEGAQGPAVVGFSQLRKEFEAQGEQKDSRYLLVLGTGWGLAPDGLAECGRILEPIRGSTKDDYRHLSVRSAASIILDRLVGTW